MFNKKYSNQLSNYSRQILRGKKPFHNRFWILYIHKLKPEVSLLDVGCGEGFFLEYAEKYYEAVGVDVSEYAINRARKLCNKALLYVKDVTKLDLGARKFDVVTCFDVLEHLSQPDFVLRNLRRNVIKPDGLLILSVPNLKSLGRIWKGKNWHGYRDPTHVSLLSKEKWIIIVYNAGFQILDVFHDWLWDSPYFPKIPSFLQHLLFKFPSTIFFFLGGPFPERFGENLYIVATPNDEI